MNLEGIHLCRNKQAIRDNTVVPFKKKSRVVVARGQVGKTREILFNGYTVSLGEEKKSGDGSW